MTQARSKPPRKLSRIDTKTRSGRRRPASGDEVAESPRCPVAEYDQATKQPGNPATTKVGVISDTHGLIRPEALAALQGVDLIFHAGDIGGDLVLDALRAIAPVKFVRGNNDDDNGYEIARITIAGRRFLLTHIFRPELLNENVDVIVFGHSHHPHNEVVDGVLLFNPGSAGPRRFKLPVMVGIIEEKRAFHVKLV